MSDLSSIGSFEDTAEITLYHPVDDVPLLKDDGEPMTVTVYGENSTVYKTTLRNQKNRALQKAQRMGRVNITAEMQEANADELLIKCVKAWSIVINGETPPATEDCVRDVFAKYPWIKDQVDAGVHERRNFLKAS